MDKELRKYRIAAASSDGIVVNQHFGRATLFYIFDIDDKNGIHFVEQRVAEAVCQGGSHDDDKLYDNVRRFLDSDYVLVSRIGWGAADALEEQGIVPMEIPGVIEESIYKLLAYAEIQKMLM